MNNTNNSYGEDKENMMVKTSIYGEYEIIVMVKIEWNFGEEIPYVEDSSYGEDEIVVILKTKQWSR